LGKKLKKFNLNFFKKEENSGKVKEKLGANWKKENPNSSHISWQIVGGLWQNLQAKCKIYPPNNMLWHRIIQVWLILGCLEISFVMIPGSRSTRAQLEPSFCFCFLIIKTFITESMVFVYVGFRDVSLRKWACFVLCKL